MEIPLATTPHLLPSAAGRYGVGAMAVHGKVGTLMLADSSGFFWFILIMAILMSQSGRRR
ncbi:MAG: hypothetical protein JO126_02960 [Alphaproteobacteria bacterium]|nr:hypothetical protein [Alphaproteobacteria bacterium]MBV8548401.1 hypothetical protein [Alphaproteobacteria bacterium]